MRPTANQDVQALIPKTLSIIIRNKRCFSLRMYMHKATKKFRNTLGFGFTSPTYTYFFVVLNLYILKLQHLVFGLSLKGIIGKILLNLAREHAHLGSQWWKVILF